tara:strand:+ start:127 stop:609 length:483 start_codon:yes stop_codon:yes gene_type:complete
MNYVLIIVLLIMFIISLLYTQYNKEKTDNIEEFQQNNLNSHNFYYLSDKKKEKEHGNYCNYDDNKKYEYDIFTLDNKKFIDNINYKEQPNDLDYLAHNEFDHYDLIINKKTQPKINNESNYSNEYIYDSSLNKYKKVELDKSKHKKWIELSDINRPWFIT